MGTSQPIGETSACARIVANPDVWLEGEAIRQLHATAADPDCVRAVGMPDLHPGPGIPIGAAFAFAQSVRPRLIGSDAGCGAIVVALRSNKFSSSTERRARAEFDDDPLSHLDARELCRAVWDRGPRGLLDFDLPDAVSAMVEHLGEDDMDVPSGPLPDVYLPGMLGTIGGGNHFAEIGRVGTVVDPQAAQALGLEPRMLAVLCHSGSRGLGKALSDRWASQELCAGDAGEYLAALAGAVRFARANRVVLAWRVLGALGLARRSKIAHAFDVVHNTVTHECCGGDALWVHRKGCAPAGLNQPTVVLGSRGARSWIMRGRGNDAGLSSVAHGAGRKMRRSEAREKIRGRYRRKELSRSANGGIAICDDTKLLYEEHPDAYKPIEPVIASLEEAELADRVASIQPLLTVKK